MDLDKFNMYVKETRLSEENRKAARAVLVEGKSRAEVEGELGVTKQRLSQIIKTVEEVKKEKEQEKATVIAESFRLISTSLELVVQQARQELGNHVRVTEVEPMATKTFSGTIVAMSTYHVAQDTGRGDVVVHSLGRLEQIPNVGKNVRLEYRDGRAAVTEKKQEREGRSR